MDQKMRVKGNTYIDSYGVCRWYDDNKIVNLDKIMHDKEITAPNGAKIVVRVRGNIVIPYGKIDYMYGGVASFELRDMNELRQLQRHKQTSRVEFDLNPANDQEIQRLKRKKYNYDRSVGMKKDLLNAGLPCTTTNINYIFDILFDAGAKATPQNNIVESDVRGTIGVVRLSSVWKFFQSGDIQLELIDVTYMATLSTKPIND